MLDLQTKLLKNILQKKFRKGHIKFCEDFDKVSSINRFKITEIRDYLTSSDNIFIGGLFPWYISPEDLELIPGAEIKDPNFFYINGDVDAYLESLKREL